MSELRWRDDHQKARTLIERGIAAQRRVAHDLLDVGLTVRLPVPSFVEPERGHNNIDSVSRFADVADILLTPRKLKIEVKERGLSFSGPEDFPYETCMMGDLRSWEQLQTPPAATVILSTSGGRMVVPTPRQIEDGIPVGWQTNLNYDSQRDIEVRSVLAPRTFFRSWNVFLDWALEQEEEPHV